jgi:hypothetical protein
MLSRRVRYFRPILVLAILCSALAISAFADSQVRIVRLSFIDGAVQLDRASGQGFERALTNMPITQGARLLTKDNGRAEVEFEDGSTVRLAPNTQVNFLELNLRSSGDKTSLAEVQEGTAYFNINHKNHDEYRVSLGGREISVERSAEFRADVGSGHAKVAVYNGEVVLKSSVQPVKVKKNETLTLDREDPERYYLAKGIEEKSYDDWNKDRDQYREEYARNRNDQYYGASPYSYGLSDLNYYGNYTYVPTYGWAWRPYGVGYGWDPFMNGAWCWYPGYGYTWVSQYPWGWTPYRYGSWLFVNGYGWVWQPGSRWNTWNAVPVIRNAPPSFQPPQPPTTPNRGTVIVGRGTATPVTPSTPAGKFINDGDGRRARPGFEAGNAPAAGGTTGSGITTVTIAPPSPTRTASAPSASTPIGKVVGSTHPADLDKPAGIRGRTPIGEVRGRVGDSDRGAWRNAPAPAPQRSAPAPATTPRSMSAPSPTAPPAASGGFSHAAPAPSRSDGHRSNPH